MKNEPPFFTVKIDPVLMREFTFEEWETGTFLKHESCSQLVCVCKHPTDLFDLIRSAEDHAAKCAV